MMTEPTCDQGFFLKLAMTGKRITPVWWAIPVALGVTLIGEVVGGISFVSLLATGLFDDPSGLISDAQAGQGMMSNLTSLQLGLLLSFGTSGAIVGVFLWVRYYEKRKIGSLGFYHLPTGLLKFLRGGLFGIAAMAVMAFGMKALGYAEITATGVPDSWYQVWPLLVLLLGWCIQGTSEEVVFRGLLFQSVAARHNLLIGLAVSSALFSLAHGMNANPAPLFFVNLVAYALFACFFALREGGLWGICGFHAMWNFAQGNLFGFAVSGETIGADRWMAFQETGPDLITGGATGPEGGLVTTLALALCTVLLLLIRPPKDFPYAQRANTDT